VEKLDTIEHWRNKIVTPLLNFVLVSGALTAIPSAAVAAVQRLWPVVGMDLAALAWLAAIWRSNRAPHTFRVANLLALIYLVGVGLTVSAGPISQIYLFAVPVLANVLLGMAPALVALACTALTIFTLSLLGYAQLSFGPQAAHPLLTALMVTLNFLFVGIIIIVSCALLLRGLAKSLDRQGVEAASLEQGKDQLQALNAELRLASFYDVLTGLPNRRLLVERIETLLAAARDGTRYGALLFIDLDRFKTINDARGHAIGDAVLRHAAERLSALASKDDTVARIGGDEFVMLLARLGDDQDHATAAALEMADRARQAVAGQFEIEGQTYSSSASIGVSLLPKPGQSAHDLLREADTAMYRAKLAGRNRVAIFEATMRAELERRLTLERDLAGALDRGELAMHLQLQVDSTGAPFGAELLARWRRADGSFVPPDQFIPVAEECGLIVPLGQWALRQACLISRQLAHAGYRLPLSVNVSPSQFRQPDFVAQVRAVLADTGAPANLLIFEVTESLLIDNLDGTLARMHELARLGIRLSIDDFGIGYSSLSYLRRMPLYELKIDRSFIGDTPLDANGTAIVQSILAMAGHLGLRAIAEGVETHEQASFLAANGATGMQGFLFARPMPVPELIGLLKAGLADLTIAADSQALVVTPA
jgi:diguanylate cyclase (GGDEF)-like protein